MGHSGIRALLGEGCPRSRDAQALRERDDERGRREGLGWGTGRRETAGERGPKEHHTQTDWQSQVGAHGPRGHGWVRGSPRSPPRPWWSWRGAKITCRRCLLVLEGEIQVSGSMQPWPKEKALGGLPGHALTPAVVCLSSLQLWQQVPARGNPRVLPELHCPGPSSCGLQM